VAYVPQLRSRPEPECLPLVDKQMKICCLADIEDGAARQFVINNNDEIFIVRQGKQLYCYRNSCPHTGAALNWLPDHFLDTSLTYIQCGSHDALFQIQNGYCVHGPCIGQSLTPCDLKLINDEVHAD